ncbi:MAG: SRPBCC family protein [Archangium sp.]
MLKKILIGLLAVLAIFFAIVASRPETFEIKRSLDINASPEVVASQITNFHKWEAWSPWEKQDAAMKKTFDGPDDGVGAHYAWDSAKVGSGEMKVTDVKPGEKVGIDLHFTKPFETQNRVDFELVKSGDKTNVSWVMTGKNSFAGKAMSVFMDMDKMVGPDFEKGLAALKDASEKAQAAAVVPVAAPPPAEGDAAATDAGTP